MLFKAGMWPISVTYANNHSILEKVKLNFSLYNNEQSVHMTCMPAHELFAYLCKIKPC